MGPALWFALCAAAGLALYAVLRRIVAGARCEYTPDLSAECRNAAVRAIECDLSDLDTVEAAASAIRESYSAVHILVANAGVCAPPLSSTRQGWELQYGVNHLGHFALVHHLLPVLIAGRARVVVVSSRAHSRATGVDFDALRSEDIAGAYSARAWYCQSKLCNVLFVRELQRRYGPQGLAAFSVHPGLVSTNAERHAPLARLLLGIVWPLLFKTAEQGAQTQLHCCLAPIEVLRAGEYYAECQVSPSGSLSRDTDLSASLWRASEQQIAQRR
eukprot:m51a1_g656 hypothetical protein (273) ;mRNA; f:224944-226093